MNAEKYTPKPSFCLFTLICICLCLIRSSGAAEAPKMLPMNRAAQQYRQLLENFAGWAEQHWKENEQCFDGGGAGVTWARGNGDVCIVYAVLLIDPPDQQSFSPRKIDRAVMLDHVRKTLRTLCLHNKNCTDPAAIKPPTWGGPTWQAGLEAEHWVFAAYLLRDQLDDATRALVRQVATAEADAAKKKIPPGKKGNTAADDCVWNAGILGVAAAFYDDDPRATSWDEWSKRWALNTEASDPERNSSRMIDGKPLSEWLVSTQVYPDITLENHGFWDLPYQVCFAALVEPALAYHISGKPIPQSFWVHADDEGESILKWLTLADGDLLYVQGIDWAELDVQHSWAYTELGTVFDQPWARAAEARCLKLLTARQAAFNDGAIHANDFGYETDLANCWAFSYLLHRYFGKADSGTEYDEPRGAKIYPYVSVGVYRTPDLISSVTWFRSRQCIMIVPNNARALDDFPSFSAYRCKLDQREISGLGYAMLDGEQKLRAMNGDENPKIENSDNGLAISFTRTVPGIMNERVGYVALPSGEVAVFTKWRADKDIRVAELVNHPFYWNGIQGFLPKRNATTIAKSAWSIDGKLQMQMIGGATGYVGKNCVIGSLRREPFAARAGETFEDSVCIYQPQVQGRTPLLAEGDAHHITLGEWTIACGDDGKIEVRKK